MFMESFEVFRRIFLTYFFTKSWFSSANYGDRNWNRNTKYETDVEESRTANVIQFGQW